MDYPHTWQAPGDRVASGTMLKNLIELAGMNQTQAARYLGISLRTMRRFAASRKSIAPVSAILLLRLMIKHNEKAEVPAKGKRKKR